MYDIDDIFILIQKFIFVRKIRPVEILKLGAVKTDSIPAIVDQGEHFLRKLDVAHDRQLDAID